ncbi:hypothetical protein RM844_27490 [Streptomyces sp. DSM 44915]|uniref:Secreted protein n=1 Tax=Streptomyces chisholmiae TaxID=3075540 RepID=A0ABU2JYI6_9ACTN|nr:hypothetical protein [Streptomyces sp. DSM 44915]MDT0270029.1 hypothetical protein [Streptomyces sp. DSM 44915]
MLAASAFLLAITLCYILLCVASPFGRCRKCDGLGHQLITKTTITGATKHRRGNDCRRCQASGLRLRIGRRAHNAWRRTYRNGTR